MSNKLYDILKWVCMVGLPAVACLWYTLGKVWGFPYIAEIGATIVAVDTFLGAILGISNIQYRTKQEGKNGTDNDQ